MNSDDTKTVIIIITAVASSFAAGCSAWAAITANRISKRSQEFQKDLEESKKPNAHIWYDGHNGLTPFVYGYLTLLNLG